MNYPYQIREVPEAGITCYTQNINPFSKNRNNFFMLDNLYFKDNKTKLDLISEIIDSGDYIIFDTETNGRNTLGESLPFQIAAIKYRNGKEVERIEFLINIGEIGEFIENLTGISQDRINREGISLDQAMDKIIRFFASEKYIIAHNASFDVSILNNALVASGKYINRDIKVVCSMQMYYCVYKMLMAYPIAGSSLDLLADTILNIDANDPRRHQADFDCEMVQMLLQRMKKDINNDLNSTDSRILNTLDIDNIIQEKISIVTKAPYADSTLNFLSDLGTTISQEFESYINEYYYEIRSIGEAIIEYLEQKTGEAYFKTETQEYCIKRNPEFSQVMPKYLDSYYGNVVEVYTGQNNYLVDFFETIRYNNVNSGNYNINNDDDLNNLIITYKELQGEAYQLERNIKDRLKIIKAHIKVNALRYYGDLEVKKYKTERSIERLIDAKELSKDINNGVIQDLNDIYTIKESFMNINISKKNK